MKNSEIVSRFNFAIETQEKEAALFLFEMLKENANNIQVSNATFEEKSDVVYDAQVARVALRTHGATEEMVSDCNF